MKKIALIILVLLSAVRWSAAQSSYMVTHYSRQDYGAGSQNWSIDTDSQGFIYAANNQGLLTYDGAHWKLFRVPDQTIIRSVSVSADKRVYTGSFEDFGYWEEDPAREMKYHSLRPLLGNFAFHNDEIWKIVQCKGKVYFQSFSALFVYDHHTVKSIPIPATIIFLLKANDRMFVQSVDGRLFELAGDTLKLLDTKGVLQGTEVKAFLPYKDGSFLIGTSSKGVFRYDGVSITPWNVPANDALKKFQINNGIISGDRIIFGTIVKGIFVLDGDGNICFHLFNENALQNNTVLSLCVDNRGGIWAGLDKGIDNISFNNSLDSYKEAGDQLGAVYTAAFSGNTLYVGTNRGIYTYRKEERDSRFRYSGFLNQSQGQVWELKMIDGTLFCGHTNGTYVITGQDFRKISEVSGGYALKKYTRDGEEFLLQSTYSTLVVYKKINRQWQYLREVKGFIEPSRFLEIDHLNNIWIGHAVKGLYRLRLSDQSDSVTSKVYYGKNDGFPSDFNIHVFKIEDRIVFTTGKLIYTYDDLNNRIIPFAELNKQLNGFENATNIIRTGENRYCLIRNNDIAEFMIKDSKATQLIRFYLPLFGLNMVEGYENVVSIDKERNLICLDDGFALFSGTSFSTRGPGKESLLFREVNSLNTQGISMPVKIVNNRFTLEHAWNSIFITFTYTGHGISSRRFQYKLEPFDPEWSQWTEKADVSYTRLPKGNYTFRVRTISSTGVVTDPIVLYFNVRPAFFASTLAYIIYALILLAGILFSQYMFRKRFMLKQEKIRLEAEAKLLLEKQQAEQQVVRLQYENLQSVITHKNIQLADSTMAIIRKNELLIEIKEELEKQKKQLRNQYPENYDKKILSLINKNITDDNDWKVFEDLFDQAHADFFKRLKAAYPDLTQSDLKLCAYLRLNLSSKEIAPLLNISYRGVETRRYRLRRRLLLENDANLVGFILQF
ncbi:MAG: triple tyrosine motif-containing protein [Bacteroidetes bacterium]|nr:triple tyrosine motif-containing protein [Bacteroidota bacterium]